MNVLIHLMVTDNIDKLINDVTWLNNHRKELISFGTNVDELSRRYELKKLSSKRLLSRVRNTPECK